MKLASAVWPWFLAAVLLVVGNRLVSAASAARPTIVVFLADDLGCLDCQPYGGTSFRTPHMQALADEGLTFDRAFVVSPSCAPSRAALLTGLYPARNGAEANHTQPRAELKKWPAFFQELGYEVVAFGKVSHYRHTALYGFDHFAHDTFHDHAAIPAAVEYLKQRRGTSDRPLCLMVGSNWPHVPWPEADPEADPRQLPLPAGTIDTPATRAWRARYAAAVAKADDDLGVIRAAVRQYLGSEVLFLFTSDHGAQWPLGKWNCYDTGIRTPLFVVWPGVTPPGTRTEAMVSWLDLLPTLLAAAGGQPPDWLDGRSFLPVLRGEATTHRTQIFTTHTGDGRWNIYPIRSLRTAAWKYIRNLHPEFAFTTHIDLGSPRDGRELFTSWEERARTDPAAEAVIRRYHARPPEELYDLRVDPHEQHNLATDPRYAERLASLRRELDAWMAATSDQQLVVQQPRLLSDPTSYGPNAPPGNAWPPQRSATPR